MHKEQPDARRPLVAKMRQRLMEVFPEVLAIIILLAIIMKVFPEVLVIILVMMIMEVFIEVLAMILGTMIM